MGNLVGGNGRSLHQGDSVGLNVVWSYRDISWDIIEGYSGICGISATSEVENTEFSWHSSRIRSMAGTSTMHRIIDDLRERTLHVVREFSSHRFGTSSRNNFYGNLLRICWGTHHSQWKKRSSQDSPRFVDLSLVKEIPWWSPANLDQPPF